ncbi:MAG: hypothetical protein AAFR38_12065 [Planctomycetota bacterium]
MTSKHPGVPGDALVPVTRQDVASRSAGDPKMVMPEQPTRPPANFFAIVSAVVVAFGGYMLFVTRYAEPLRELDAMAERVESIDSRVQSVLNRTQQQAGAETGDLSEINIRLAEVEAVRGASARRIQDLEAEIRALKIVAQQQGLNPPVIAGVTTSPVEPASPDPSTDAARQAQSPTVTTAAPSSGTSPTPQTLVSATRGDLRIDVLNARVARGNIVFDAIVTKLTGGDGYFAIRNHAGDVDRLVTADGYEFDRFRAGRPGGAAGSRFNAELVAGTPMRFQFSFRGEVPSPPFVARRVEFTAHEDPSHKLPLQFRFENVLVSE